MKQCPQCNTQCDDAKNYCPNCGNLLVTVAPPQPQLVPPQPKENKKLLMVLLAVSFVANIVFVIIILGGGINGLCLF